MSPSNRLLSSSVYPLLLTLPLLLAAAWSLSVSVGRARLLVAISLLVFGLNFGIPMLVSFTSGGMPLLDQSGPLLRLAIQLGALLFALLAAREAVR